MVYVAMLCMFCITLISCRPMVPNVIGLPEQEAKRRITEARLHMGSRTEIPAPPAQEGRVLTQRPPAETRVRTDSTVDVSVGVESVIVPSIEGLLVEQALASLQQTRLHMGKKTETPARPEQKGRVLTQHPQAKTRVRPDSSVDISVGAESVIVPPLEGLSVAQASTSLQQARLRLGRQIEEPAPDDRIGIVLSQRPPSGTLVHPRSGVNVSVGVESVIVPSIEGRSIDEASKSLQNTRLHLGEQTGEPAPPDRMGLVLSQRPSAGTRVRPDSRVAVSVGIESALVPRLKGLSLERVANLLQQASLLVGDIKEVRPGPNAGTIVGQRPSPGEWVRPGSTIDVDVVPASVVVPRLKGLMLAQASGLLQQADLLVGDVEEGRLSPNPGTIVEQRPSPGEWVRPGSIIDVTVIPDSLVMPQVEGISVGRATNILQQNGLLVGRIRNVTTQNAAPGTVLEQEPASGERVRPGTEVDLKVAKR